MSRNITTIPSGDSTLPSTAEAGFGSFVFFCRDVPSVPWCNLFYNQLSRTDFDLPDSRRAPVGIDPVCGIRRATGGGNVGNIANMIACILCAAFTFYLIQRANRRKAAVGRVELRATLGIYLLTCLVQFVTIGALLEQGSIPLVVLTAVHAGLIASLFWCLIGNAVIATQVVEDGTPASLLPFHGFSIVFFLATTYISLDTAFGFTKVFQSNPPEHLKNIALFILLELWPVFAILVFFGIMSYISIRTLQETKPFLYYLGALLVFAGSQAVYLIASTPLCQMSNRLLDGSFIATILETASLGLVFAAWMAITEGSWDVQYFPA